MFIDKLGGIELPLPPPINIKIKENPKLFAIYTILEIKIKTIQLFVCYPMQEDDMQLKKHFDESKAGSGFLKTIWALWGQISRPLVSKF